jgi:hypothetical protein
MSDGDLALIAGYILASFGVGYAIGALIRAFKQMMEKL